MPVFRYCESRLHQILQIKLKQPQPGLAGLRSEEEEHVEEHVEEDMEEEVEEAGWRGRLAQRLDLTANEIYWETQVDSGRQPDS